jgi:hypothetical protein
MEIPAEAFRPIGASEPVEAEKLHGVRRGRVAGINDLLAEGANGVRLAVDSETVPARSDDGGPITAVLCPPSASASPPVAGQQSITKTPRRRWNPSVGSPRSIVDSILKYCAFARATIAR